MIKSKAYLYVIAALAVTCIGLAGSVMHAQSQRDAARTELAEYRSAVVAATAQANNEARAKEADLQAKATVANEQLAKEKDRAKALENRLVADIRAGTQRLSIAARCPTHADQTPADSAPAPVDGAEGARAELDPETAATLVAIAADGDEAIRERNACIAAYDNIRETLNAR